MDLPNYTVLIQLLNFLVLIFLMNMIVYRPVRKMLTRRREVMDGSAKSARELMQKADAASEELDSNISETRKEGQQEKEKIKTVGLGAEQEMLKEVHSSTEDMLSTAREEIGEKLISVRHSLQSELKGFSKELAGKILGRQI